MTPQRQLLFTLLVDDATHPTAEGLYTRASDMMPGISLRTVYSTLTDLVEMGELNAVTVGSGATRFDPNIDEHHHGVCEECGAVVDLYVESSQSLSVETADGFMPRTASIVFHGTCATCAGHSKHSAPTSSSNNQSTHQPQPNKEHHHG